MPAAVMEIRQRREGAVAIVELAGRLTINDQPGQLKSAIADALKAGARHALLDLSGVRYIDSTRLGELIAAHVTVSRQGGALKLAGAPQRIIELLHIAGLEDVFEHYDSVAAALDSFN
jgi:anti-sigma B factor antagonist